MLPRLGQAPAKTRHSALMLLAATILADFVRDDAAKRILGRYTFLYGDSMLLWASRWRNALKRDRSTSARARQAEPALGELRSAVEAFSDIRDYLAAKRQPHAVLRADDMEGTLRLWASINRANVEGLAHAARQCYDALAGGGRIIEDCAVDVEMEAAVKALPTRDPHYWYVAADTAAELRPHTLPAAQGGPIGRAVAQVNDVAMHLELVLGLLPITFGRLPYDFLIRSTLFVELSALLDLTIGPPDTTSTRGATPALIDLCRHSRAEVGARELQRLTDTIVEGRELIRWVRNRLGAHVDDAESLYMLYDVLIRIDLDGLTALATHVLTWLDAIACAEQNLRLMVLGERKVQSWPVRRGHEGHGLPTPGNVAGAVANLFRQFDSPYVIGTGSTYGSAVVSGIMAGRRPHPRPTPPLLSPRPEVLEVARDRTRHAFGV